MPGMMMMTMQERAPARLRPTQSQMHDVENTDGLRTLLRDGITRSVFSKSWWNAFGSMLRWPHKARELRPNERSLRPNERSLRPAYVFAQSVRVLHVFDHHASSN